ncbi:MAG: hypothetical protein NUV61_01565 [Candidatus Azambacteria bacterium]|nr:hypothetical protein [Candidatus Azambacteria bacterium]
MKKAPDSQKGVGMLEIVIAIAIISASFFSVLQISTFTLKVMHERNDKAKALTYAQEGIEAVRNMRDGGWTANIAVLTFGTPYYLTTSGSQWALTGVNPGMLDGKFTRTIILDNVSRDINDDIVVVGGTDDPKTKKVTATVSWGSPAKSVQLVTYITDILKN